MKMLRQPKPPALAWCVAAAVLAAMASMVRATGPLLVPAMILGLWLRRGARQSWRTNLLLSLLLIVIVAVPLMLWVQFASAHAARPESAYFRNVKGLDAALVVVRNAVGVFPRHVKDIADAALGLRVALPLALVILAAIIVGMISAVRRGPSTALRAALRPSTGGHRMLAAYTLLTMGAVLAGGLELTRRYLLPVLPILYLWLGLGAAACGRWLQRHSSFWTEPRLRGLGYAAAVLVLAANLLRIADTIGECRSSQFPRLADEGRGADYAPLTEWLRGNCGRDDGVLSREWTVVRSFSQVRGVPYPDRLQDVTPEVVTRLIQDNKVRYVVRDARDAEILPALDRLRADHPGAFMSVLEMERVILFRVDVTSLPS